MLRYFSSLMPRNTPITVAVSAGVDSVAFAYFLAQTRREYLSVFHFNHKLRPQNDEMELAVRKFASDLDVPLTVANAIDYPLGENTSFEAAAREARLNAMQELCKHPVVICHHLDDAVESLLMKTLDGVSSDYHCIPPFTKFEEGLTFLRPFLLTQKAAIKNYAKRKNLERYVVEDETNRIDDCRRNLVRNQLLPLIHQEWKGGFRKVVYKKVQEDYRTVLNENFQHVE